MPDCYFDYKQEFLKDTLASSQIYRSMLEIFFPLIFSYHQIWLNCLLDDRHFSYIKKLEIIIIIIIINFLIKKRKWKKETLAGREPMKKVVWIGLLDGVLGEVNRQLLAIVLVVCFQTQVKFMAWQQARRHYKATRE
jgi:uncharacterized membrane protein YbhN (UPF0104 family)